jgi:tetratricopeptide (TPR) repeat protein
MWLRQLNHPGSDPRLGPTLLQIRRAAGASLIAMEAGDHGGLRVAVDRLLGSSQALIALSAPEQRLRPVEFQRRYLFPWAAAAMARLGDPGAREMAARAPLDCYDCVRARGTAAAAAGDRREAERWFAEAVRQGPSIPFAYDDWGRLLLAAGDAQGAMRQFAAAHRVGPRWADPLKHMGDALARMGRERDALRRYAQAAERAPHWGALHVNWGQALWRLGRHEDARARFRAAARLNLAPADAARLRRLWPVAFA